MTAVIIEDELNSASALQSMVNQYCEGLSCNGIFSNVNDGLTGIQQNKPDLVFLDIMLQNQNGFDLLAALPRPHPQIIFTTAYDHFAIQAIRFSALDYLLKPLSIKELQAAVVRAQHNLVKYGINKLNELVQTITHHTHKLKRIAIPTFEGHVFVDIENIIRFEASGSYTKVILTGDHKELLVSRQLKEYEQMLEPCGFVRAHHSHVVNCAHISKYIRGNGGYLMMTDGKTVDVSQRKKEDLMKVLRIH